MELSVVVGAAWKSRVFFARNGTSGNGNGNDDDDDGSEFVGDLGWRFAIGDHAIVPQGQLPTVVTLSDGDKEQNNDIAAVAIITTGVTFDPRKDDTLRLLLRLLGMLHHFDSGCVSKEVMVLVMMMMIIIIIYYDVILISLMLVSN